MSKNSKLIVYTVLIGLLLSLIGVCSATVSYKWNQIVIEDESDTNLTDVYNRLYPTYGNSLIYTEGKGVWYVNKTILCDRSNLSIKYPEVTELRIDNTDGYRYTMHGTSTGSDAEGIVIDGITYVGWNSTSNAPDEDVKRSVEIDRGHVSNSTFMNVSRLTLYNVKDIAIQNITMTKNSEEIRIEKSSNLIVRDINMYDTGYALTTDNLDNCTFYNISGCNIKKGQIRFERTNNSLFYNISATNFGSHLSPSTGSGGIYWYESSNNIGHDFYINDTGWSGFAPGYNYGYWYNITVYNSGHNGIDLHNIQNTIIENASIYDSVSNNILITAGYVDSRASSNITIRNVYSRNSGIVAQTNVSDIIIENLEQEGSRCGMGICAKNFTLINSTLNREQDAKITIYNTKGETPEKVSIIDTSLYWLSAMYGADNKLINSIYTQLTYKNHTLYYYPYLIIQDGEGTVLGSNIEFINEVNNSYSSVNGLGKETKIFNTKDGRTLLPKSNREDIPAIAGEYISSDGTYYKFTHTAKVSDTDGRTVSLSGITPDSSWYRPNPNIPTYTITAIIPNCSSKGPDIIGFAPSRENPFNPGEKKNFRVWTDEPLTSMEWLVNGSSVLKGSLNYTWTVTDRNTTIEFRGSNANGPVNHKWDLGESSNETSGNDSIEDEIPEDDEIPEQEVIFSPADSMITLNVSEKTVFSVSPDIFTTKEWYINGYPIQNNTTSMTRCWSTAGTHDVTFKGAGSGEPVSHTWTVNVVEEKKNDEESTESIIAITPEYQIVKPKQSFGLDITVDPSTPIIGTQIDFIFNSSMASANSASEGDLFKQKGASTFFNEGDINSSGGTIKHIYGLIIGTSNVSSPGTFATVNLTAGNRTGMAEFSLSNVLISDINSKSVPYTVTNATVLIDTAPVIDPVCCPKSVDEKSNLAFKISAKDADGDRLTLSASGLPEGSSFNRTSGNFTWTPAVGQAGVYTITFKVCDGYLTDFENVTVTVNKLNNPPVINFFEPINGSSFSEGERIGISVNATDAEKQALNYSIKIDGVMYSSDPAYIWETDYSSSGNHTIEVSVSDRIDEIKRQHTIYISECHPRWDVNEDGVVNILDLSLIHI
ncbi:putative Ig domain-containing protein [Methanosarcina mazei]|uniref:putative Ig domain-containing protein n=1 Tax=Methanosarcina mazei TaxID=2209 RepID=UPI000A67B6C9|nr:putative Ig domain-containing protein [Methanosarcina mazei]